MDKRDVERHLDGLMTLLAVARLGRFTAAGDSLGVTHSTVSRRIESLGKSLGGRVIARASSGWELTPLGQRALNTAERVEQALVDLVEDDRDRASLIGGVRLGTPDAFAVHIAAPAMAQLQQKHRHLSVELISATQRARQSRSGLDLEVVVGRPEVRRATVEHVMDYALRLYATEEYLEEHGTPVEMGELVTHRLNYYVESVLTVDELDHATERLPPMLRGIASTNVLSHVTATLAGAGIGLLPDYVAETHGSLVRILPDQYAHKVSYWAVGREEALRSPTVQGVYVALRNFSADIHPSRH